MGFEAEWTMYPTLAAPQPKSLSQSGRGTLNPKPPSPFLGEGDWGMRANLHNWDALEWTLNLIGGRSR
jgi:hypothetical protein